MTATYDCIATTTLGSDANSVTFSSISGSYTDLIAVVSPASTSIQDQYIRFNSDTGSNYSYTILSGTGSSAVSSRQSSQTFGTGDYYGTPSTTLGESTTIWQFMNYSNTTTFKTALVRSNRASSGVDAIVNLWRSTAAITSITFYAYVSGTTNYKTGSTFTLYGIKAE
jgi:hypothetical protein